MKEDIDLAKLAKALCKADVDPKHTDTPDVIWSQMRSSLKTAYMARAGWVIDFYNSASNQSEAGK